jgi:putative transposase
LSTISENVLSKVELRRYPKLRAWFAARSRFHVHYTPTYSSWLNLVEWWFAILTKRQIRRSSYVSAKDLIAKIEAFVTATKPKSSLNHNLKSVPWVLTGDRY